MGLETGQGLLQARDLPSQYGEPPRSSSGPKKMVDYIRRRPYTENNDYGEVHLDSGIDNWAATRS